MFMMLVRLVMHVRGSGRTLARSPRLFNFLTDSKQLPCRHLQALEPACLLNLWILHLPPDSTSGVGKV